MIYMESLSPDPRWNLAMEQYVFEKLPKGSQCIYFWRNHNTIVVGKNQNTVGEINNEFVRQHGITVVRRMTGGGTVYQDLGNLNYSFIADAGEQGQIDFQRFCAVIVEALASYGVAAQISGRNDITVDGKKFSGNAQLISHGRVLHHGTIMFSTDLEVLSKALQVDQQKIESKGIQSVTSRVTNLSEHLPAGTSMESLKSRILTHISRQEPLVPYALTSTDRAAISAIVDKRYATWAWNYGKSPAYSINRKMRLENCGMLEVSYSVKDGVIQAIQLFGDFFGAVDVEELEQRLTGCLCNARSLAEALRGMPLDKYIRNISQSDLIRLIIP